VNFADEEDLDAIVALGQARMGADHVPADVLRARLERQPGCVGLLRTSGRSAPTACSILYALTETATAEVLERRLVRGSMLKIEHLALEGAGFSVYIGSLVSSPGRGIRALDLMLQHLSWLLERHPKAGWLFGREATHSGTKLLDRFHFTALSPPSQIQALQLPPGDAALVRHLLQSGGSARVWNRLLDHVDDRGPRHDDL
jgi:hypothetical protein